MKLLKYLYFSICFLFLMAFPVHAYVDPSVVTTAVQVIAGVAVVVKNFKNKRRRPTRNIYSKRW